MYLCEIGSRIPDRPYKPAKLTRTLKWVSGGRLMALNYLHFIFLSWGVTQSTRNEKVFIWLKMGLDLLLFQADKDGEPELIKASQRARLKSEAIVDEIQEEYKEWTRGTFYFPPHLLTIYSQVWTGSDQQRNQLYAKRNRPNIEGENSVIGIIWLIVKAKGDAKELVAKKSKLEQKKKDIQVDAESRKEALDKKVRSVGNIVDKSVPISQNEVSVSRFLRQLNLGWQQAFETMVSEWYTSRWAQWHPLPPRSPRTNRWLWTRTSRR